MRIIVVRIAAELSSLFLFLVTESGHHVDAAASMAGGAGRYRQGSEAAFGKRSLAMRAGVSPAQLAMVTVLQFTEDLTARQAADACGAGWTGSRSFPGSAVTVSGCAPHLSIAAGGIAGGAARNMTST